MAALLGVALTSFIAARAFADTTGEHSPTATSGAFPNASEAFACDGVVTSPGNNDIQTYSVYGLTMPVDAIITGIQVRVRANDGTSNNRKFRVSLSWDGGTTFTSTLNTRNFRRNTPLRDYIVGGSAVLWGRTSWSASELSDVNFRVRLKAQRPGGSEPINLDCVPVTVFYRLPGAPNLSISKSDGPDPVQPQQDLTYTIAYSNSGESTATNVVITDVVPANTTFVSASPAPASAPAVGGMGTVTWNVPSVSPGGSGVLTLVVKVDASLTNGTQILNQTYSISGDQNTPTAGSVVATTVEGTIALSATKTASPDPVAPGGTLTYVVTIANGGNAASTTILIDETYDGNVSSPILDSTTCVGLISNPPDLDQFTIPNLGAGTSCVITIDTTVTTPLADGVLLTNVVDILDDGGHSAQASVITTVLTPAVCGDSAIQAGEDCDEGGANGAPDSCCTATCAFRSSTEVCRPADGDCDTAEHCTGASATCPSDSFVSAGDGCADEGNPCTDNECDGAGACTHPPNEDPCDDGEGCTIGDVCSGGICQPGAPNSCNDNNPCTNDSCSSPSGACVNAPNSNPCDDLNGCTLGDVCSGGSCQSGALKDCSDSNPCTDNSCSAPSGTCVSTPNTDPCDDGDACSTGDQCADNACNGTLGECGDGTRQPSCGEECDDGNIVNGDGCAANCTLEPCGPEPEATCARPAIGQKASVILRNKADDRRDSLTFRWIKGAATQKIDFGNPTLVDTVDDDYQFCIYRNSAPRLALSANVPAGGLCGDRPCWKEARTGFSYRNRDRTPDGLSGVGLKEGEAERARIMVRGKGSNLDMPDLTTLDSPVTVQLKNLKSGKCWEAVYSFPPAGGNTPELFKDKAD